MSSPPDLAGAIGREADRKLQAATKMIRRTGASQFQLRFHDDEQPVVWLAVAVYPDGRAEVDASLDPLRALLRLCERLVDGGLCTHCGRPTGLDPDSLETMPMSDTICWWQYRPDLGEFQRGCASDPVLD